MRTNIFRSIAVLALTVMTSQMLFAQTKNPENLLEFVEYKKDNGSVHAEDTRTYSSLEGKKVGYGAKRFHNGKYEDGSVAKYRPGCGFDLQAAKEIKSFVFGIYKLEEKVMPYSRIKYEITFKVYTSNYAWRSMANLYTFDTIEEAMSANITTDLDEDDALNNPQPANKRICGAWANWNGTWKSNTGYVEVDFDNRKNPKAKTYTKYYLLAVTNDANNVDSRGDDAVGCFEVISCPGTLECPLKGEGTTEKPFLINNADELEMFRNMVNEGWPGISGKLTNDIDMDGRNWIPIGRYTVDETCRSKYTGTFNGDGHVIRNLSGGSSVEKFMGLIGNTERGCIVKNLILENVNFTSEQISAGLTAYGSNGSTIENVGVVGDIMLSNAKGRKIIGGIAGFADYNLQIKNCYTFFNSLCYDAYDHATKTYCFSGSTAMEKAATGELCYLLNGSKYSKPLAWYQNIGKDKYPVLRGANIVFKTGSVYHNGELQFEGTGTVDDPFLLKNESDLRFFADKVNMGFTTICGKLVADIDYTSHGSVADMIGTASYPYSGTFIGDGHSIKMNFSTGEEYTGLFRYTNNATIGNLMLLGSVSGKRIFGALIAKASGKTTVTDVMNKVELSTSSNGDGTIGGFAAMADNRGTLTMINCAFTGKILAGNTNCNGGFVGWIGEYGQVNLTNSYFAPEKVEIKFDNNDFTFVRFQHDNSHAYIKNCYYTQALGNIQGTSVTQEQIKSGELCFMLNGQSNTAYSWLQTIGTDPYPTLWLSKRVYRLDNGTYSNESFSLPGSGTEADPFLIGSPIDLETFRDIVNKMKIQSACARLTADIDMMDRNWIPIGRYTDADSSRISYSGIFDGDGFVIRNLSGRSETDQDFGLIGHSAEGCTVKNLIMENVKLEGGINSAPFIGYCEGKTTIEYCASIGLLKFSSTRTGTKNFGGIIGKGSKENMNSCYTVYSSLSGSNEGTANTCYYGAEVEKKASTGELCYLLNGSKGTDHHWLQTLDSDSIHNNKYPVQRDSKKVDRKNGKYYNVEFSESDNTTYGKDLTSNDFKVIHHGGNLYEFVVTLGTKDGKGEHRFPDMKLSYNEDGSWVDIAELKKINRDSVAFKQNWSGEITYTKGEFINPHTFQQQTPVFWIMQGNHSSSKATSLLWLAPKGTKPIKIFKAETQTKPTKQVTSLIQPSAAPTGANAVIVTEPTMDMNNKKPGTVSVILNTPNPAYSLGVWDATDNRFISTQENPDGAQNITISLPQQDCIHEIVALMYARQVDMVGTKQDTTYVTYGVPMSVKPLHRIVRSNANQTYNASNNLRWAIAFPKDEDLISDDMFSLSRALKSDYSDATSLKSFSLNSYTETTEENDTLMGWYSYSDKSQEALSTTEKYEDTKSAFDQWNLTGTAQTILTEYKYPARYIYYNVERATTNTVWTTDSTVFRKRWKVLLTNVLPRVDSVKVIKTDEWERTHKVKLRLVLKNPYPEDLVPEDQKSSVKEERKRQGFNTRMFAWDEKAKIVIRRFSPDHEHYLGVDEAAETFVVEGREVKEDELTGNWYAEVFDIQTAPETHYYYSAKVDNSESDYPICINMKDSTESSDEDAIACYSKTAGKITDFKASQGEFIGKVNLSWESDNTGKMNLTKKTYKFGYDSGQSSSNQEYTIPTSGKKATDDHSLAGQVDEYTLTKTITRRGQTFCDTVRTYGYSIYRAGKISGHVRMPNGMAFPGEVTVRIKVTNPSKLHVNDIYTPDGKILIMKGYSPLEEDTVVVTDENGYYEIDSLCYYGTGVVYTVSAESGNASFVNTTGGSGGIDLTLENACNEFSNVDFICKDTHQISGRIVYAGSTVPVRDMEFYVNGQKLVEADGKAIVTDAMGNFSFPVPKFKMSIQARKEGHVLQGGGYVLGGDDGSEKEFTPTKDYEVTMSDSTTIRLVGRVAGGNTEGSKEIGFGDSKNILGDSITLVLQLEGDNTSFIHYNLNNPDEKSMTRTFTQDVCLPGGGVLQFDRTNASFESKRIVIKADNKTGEFCLDLFPAKYKLSQVYANGYGTLYLANEGISIIDLTDSTVNRTYEKGNMQTSYCASFNKIYHSPAKLTLTQTDGASSLGYYGEKSINVSMVTGAEEMTVAWTQDGKAGYTFGHPVFQGGTTYTFMAEAYEEYHYNNAKSGALTRVPVGGHKLTVTNGFDSTNPIIKGNLNSNGKLSFTITPTNAIFNATGENALMALGAAVDVEGYSYEAEAIKAFVTGDRDMGVEVEAALECKPQILDYIRDPYGANSYAYREKGTQYNWTSHYESDFKRYIEFDWKFGAAWIFGTAVGGLTANKVAAYLSGSHNWITEHEIEQEDGEYHLTLKDRIETSSDPLDVGAMADIYIGSVSTVDIRKTQSFNIINGTTYDSLFSAIQTGAVKVVSEGFDKYKKREYLVVADGIYPAPGTERTFIYTQKYILGTLIPNLERSRDRIGLSKDSVKKYNNCIKDWQDVIKANEEIKVKALSSTNDVSKYSISGACIDHSEEGSSYYRKVKINGAGCYTWSLYGNGGKDSGSPKTHMSDENYERMGGEDEDGEINVDVKKHLDHTKKQISKLEGWGFLLEGAVGGGSTTNVTNNVRNYITTIGGSGYHLTCTDNSYIDLDVVKIDDPELGSVHSNFKNYIDLYEGGDEYRGNDYQNGEYTSQKIDTLGCYAHNYVFIQRGGASRNPWSDADSTFFYLDASGNRQALGARSLRIDNPKISVENPIVYNQPQDEPAVFTIHLTNDTEINDKSKYLNPTTLLFKVDEGTNPDGAKIFMDGKAMKTAEEFCIDPGQSITKTLEVVRGGKPYDYNNIKLYFADQLLTIVDTATISVHYVPNATPVNLSMPADNWLMNTLSQVDKDGRYYVPVQIDGFSTTQYDNFDHIELQYKKQTESEDQWVNLCSYFADKALYEKASGQKAMIEDPTKITNIKFYGEKDPIEMKYDLRAVAFCRLGNGYVTRASKVVSGTKDTRCPEVFGKPKPTDGILGFDDVISLPFTENIAYNYLDKTANFSVQGYTNSSDADHSAYLYFPGTPEQQAVSKVKRFCTDNDFSVEMMVKAECQGREDEAVFFSLVDDTDLSEKKGVTSSFGYLPDEDRLFVSFGGNTIKSEKLSSKNISISSAMTHVAVTYSAADSILRFYVGDTEVKSATKGRYRCDAKGYLSLGTNYKGRMSDIALWGITLSDYEVANKYKRALSAGEKGLVGYWPTDETNGNVISDKANGADIYLNDVTWQTPAGYSLRVNRKPVELTQDARLLFSRDQDADYTLGFWFRTDETAPDSTVLFAAGSDDLAEKGMSKMRILFSNGELLFRSEGKLLSFGSTKETLPASVWHHVAVSVNHSFNTASLFLDGKMVAQTSADSVSGIASSKIAFGDSNFVGNFDNITLWSIALPADYIQETRNTDYSGREAELVVNMNFEQQSMNSQGTMYVDFSPCNNVIKKGADKIEGKVMVDEAAVSPDNKIYAPIRSGTGIQTLPFSWSSTDNELQINVLKTDAEINNQKINLVVRNVEDLNGNPMKNPHMWTVYVNRNVIDWNVDHLKADVRYGNDTTLVVGFRNKSGHSISYEIESRAKWVSIDKIKGSIEPLSSDDITLKIDRNMAPGSYSTFIYITDENDLVSKLNLEVNVVAATPFVKTDMDNLYNETMNVIAIVKKKTSSDNWVIDMNKNDYVAAFIDNVCLSVTPLSVDGIKNTSYAFMTINGYSNLQNKKIEFFLWNSSDGQIYTLEPGTEKVTESGTEWIPSAISYTNRKVVGGDDPVVMRTSKQKIQWITLDKGWNWVSLNIKSQTDSLDNNLFLGTSEFTTGDLIQLAGTNFASYQSDKTWDEGMKGVHFNKNDVFQIYSQNGGQISVRGTEFENDERVAQLIFKNGSVWASLPYLLDISQNISTALSDFVPNGKKAPAGTVIKSHDEFAVATINGQWLGSLKYLIPGKGYYVKRNGLVDTVSVKYTNTITTQAPERVTRTVVDGIMPGDYVSSMAVIANFKNGEYYEGDILLAISDGKIVGAAEKIDGYFFLTVNANVGSKIQFAKMRNGQLVACTRKGIRYTTTDILGSLQSPYIIDFSETGAESVYDLTGIKYSDIESIKARRGVFIINGEKIMR